MQMKCHALFRNFNGSNKPAFADFLI